MTKEEILNKHGRLISGPALAAMDEYAKQQAIAYAKFVILKFEPHGDNYVSKNHMDNEVYFNNEVYSQFIKQQTENK